MIDQQPDEKQREAMRVKTMRDVLDRVIDAHLMTREADRKGVRATDDEIDRAIDSVMKQAGLASRKALLDEVEKTGLTIAEYRAEIARQIVEIRLVQLAGIKSDSQEKFERDRKEYLARLRKSAYIEVRL